MPQITIRLDEELARQVKAHAAGQARSVNSWVVAVLNAAVNPELEDDAMERTRARLRRAGLLAQPLQTRHVRAPDARRLDRARKAAGTGTPLSRLVSDARD